MSICRGIFFKKLTCRHPCMKLCTVGVWSFLFLFLWRGISRMSSTTIFFLIIVKYCSFWRVLAIEIFFSTGSEELSTLSFMNHWQSRSIEQTISNAMLLCPLLSHSKSQGKLQWMSLVTFLYGTIYCHCMERSLCFVLSCCSRASFIAP